MNFVDPWDPTYTISENTPPANVAAQEDAIDAVAVPLEFEDNFIPEQPQLNPREPQDNRLPDSDSYIRTLERRLHRLKNNLSILQQLTERRNACMQSLLNGDITLHTEAVDELQNTLVNGNELLRFYRPDQALTQIEIEQLLEHDHLQLQAEENEE
ncbi:uncharacterized protein LOC128723966 [Anopheles nili]|uniref:uncharacterized protein LOC128723966 n=1 Tax=Anopheles nili TaxID=185578 RepID=UPI00237AAC80|nr:uncharacterized protein LOC128723966 [Anopheles nili]